MRKITDLPDEPIPLFQEWYQEASGKIPQGSALIYPWHFILKLIRSLISRFYPPLSMHQPDSMVLATATAGGQPSVRVVLYKGLREGGLVFYTNYKSRKGRDLLENPKAAIVFHWGLPERQVRWMGSVKQMSYEESNAYWQSRPYGSQVSGASSPQSQKVKSREELKKMVKETEAHYKGNPIPCPEHWGGFILMPETVEFWEGAANRLHYRVLYSKNSEKWEKSILAP